MTRRDDPLQCCSLLLFVVLFWALPVRGQAPDLQPEVRSMTRAEFRDAFARLTQARGSEYIALREQLVAAGATIVPWLAEEEESRDRAGRAFDATVLRLWIEHNAHVRLCNGVLDGSVHAPHEPPRTQDEDRIVILVRVGAILAPRLVEGIVRSDEYRGHAQYIARKALSGIGDPRAQEPLRRAMVDRALTMDLRMDIAELLSWVYRDSRPLAFAEAIARDDDTPPSPRGRAIVFLADREERQILALVRELLQRPGIDGVLATYCIEAIARLRDEASAPLLEHLLTSRALPEDARSAIPLTLHEVGRAESIYVMERASRDDPSPRVREAARFEAISLGRRLQPASDSGQRRRH
jgi:hypothetical protein